MSPALLFLAKTVFAALVLSFCSWLAGRMPQIAGFIIALPLSTLLALAFTQAEFGDPGKSVEFARGIFSGIGVSLLFFVPFLLADKLRLGFWTCYLSGVGLLVLGFFVHRAMGRMLG